MLLLVCLRAPMLPHTLPHGFDDAHYIHIGRPWSVQELRNKSWEDLHKLWWVCVKERNRIATSNLERSRLKAGFGDHESNQRDDAVSTPSILFQESVARSQAISEYPIS